MACRVSECCCGCSLKTGSISIGIGNAVYNGLCLLVTIVMAARFPYQDPTAISEDDRRVDKTAFILDNCINGAVMLLNIIFNYLLVYGVCKEKPTLIKSWIFYTITFLVVHGVLNGIFCTMHLSYGEMQQGAICLFAILLNLALQGYFIVVVRSYLDEVEGSRNRPTFNGILVFQDDEEVAGTSPYRIHTTD